MSRQSPTSGGRAHTNSGIQAIEPLHKDEGRPFVISDWQEWVKRRRPAMSWHELETGERPQ